MREAETLVNFQLRITSDRTLTSRHISMCTALCSLWIENQFANPFPITRKALMSVARIKSTSTYHQVMKDLVSRNHVVYSPSCDPSAKSEASIVSTPIRVGKRALEPTFRYKNMAVSVDFRKTSRLQVRMLFIAIHAQLHPS